MELILNVLSHPIPVRCFHKIIGKRRRSVLPLPERGAVGHTPRAAVMERVGILLPLPLSVPTIPRLAHFQLLY